LHKNNWKGEKAMASPLANKKSRSVEQDNIQQQLEMLKLIFNSIHSGLIVTDAEGYITHLSQPFAEFLKVDPEEQIGRHCTDADRKG
jgi:transcriptional regulator with PAS, ATPase and Fis domain